MPNAFGRPTYAAEMVHGVVYRNDREFSSHPFVGGLWRNRDGDLLAGFMRADCNYGSASDVHHDNINIRKRQMMVIRSATNGADWDQGSLQVLFETPVDPKDADAIARETTGEPPLDFSDPNVLIANESYPALFVPEARTWLRASADGGKTWRPAVTLPLWGLPSLSGHGSAMVRADGLCLLSLTTVTPDGWTRRPLIYASQDGIRWYFLSFITPREDDGAADSPRTGSPRFGAHRYMYPRTIALADGRLLTSLRCQRDPTSVLWTEMHVSHDGGRTWSFLSRVNDWGAPGDIVAMKDGRVVCVYGYRMPPYGIRARVSEDGGATWGPELILRDDGGSWIGYPRVIEHEEGRLLAIYYMNLRDDPLQMNGGVRHVAQTTFTP